ncbi:MAG: UvrD-helicase domain-containing protein [Clostridiales bacterium]
MRSWNRGQSQAIDATGANILVSAAAGTGKTAVLVERLIKRLTDPVSPLAMDRFLLVTFTNAAAQEMTRRVRKGLEERLRQEPGNRLLKQQQLLLGQAAISTLHSFCLDLIRRHYQELGVDPQSRVLSEPEKILMQGEVLDSLLEECYEENDPAFAALTAAYGGEKTDASFKQLILRVYEFAAAQPQPFDWLDNCVALYRSEAGLERLIPFLLDQTAASLNLIIRSLDKGGELADSLPALKKYSDCLRADSEKLGELSQLQDWDVLTAVMEEKAAVLFGRLPSIPQKAAKDEGPEAYEIRLMLQQKIKSIRDKGKKEFRKLAQSLIGENRQQLAVEVALMAPAITTLAGLTAKFYRSYEEAKQEKNVLDFSDIEHYALALLFDESRQLTNLARILQERYEEVLVDEYQDINPIQEALLQALRGQSFFMVGDIKQSIYGFRQAAPHLFLEKFRRYKEGGEGCLVMLEESYRSSQWVVAGINQVFDHCMTEATCGIDYRREGRFIAALPLGPEACPRADEGLGQGALELHVIAMAADEISAEEGEGQAADVAGTGAAASADEADAFDAAGAVFQDEPEEETENLPEPDALQTEAFFCAQRISGLQQEVLWDRSRGQNRPIEYRDIVILLPAMKGVADAFVQALQSRGIPVYADMGGGYFQAQEVLTALSFLKILDNPRQDIPLAAVMLSPAFGFTPADLAKIKVGGQRNSSKAGGLYTALVRAAAREKELAIPGLRSFLQRLKEYRLYARRASVADVLLRFYEDTGFLIMAGAMAGGLQRRANLLALIQRAREFEETNLQGLYQFINYLEALEKKGADLATPAVVGEGENVVRMMSIHKSKGLEFPIVFLATAGRAFMMKESRSDLLLHESLGMASAVIQPRFRIKYAGAYHRLVAAKILQEQVAEQQRLLYVALTRAEQRLVVVTADKKGAQRYQQWQEEKYRPGERAEGALQALSFMDWLGPAVLGYQGTSPWVSRLWAVADITREVKKEKEQKRLWQAFLTLPELDRQGSLWSFIDRQLSWRYPWEKEGQLAAKLSVTQARGRLYPEEDPEAEDTEWSQRLYQPRLEGPRFLQKEKTFTGAERGTLLHRVLARIGPHQGLTAIREMEKEGKSSQAAAAFYLDGLLEQLTRSQFLSPWEKEAVDRQLLLRFLLSDLFKRLAAADAKGNCWQEASFIMAVPASRMYGGVNEDEIVVQGTIDVFFTEGDGLVLVDYKSDRTKPGQEGDLLRRYSGQLRLYGEGLEAFTGQKVSEMMLYSLALGKEIKLL